MKSVCPRCDGLLHGSNTYCYQCDMSIDWPMIDINDLPEPERICGKCGELHDVETCKVPVTLP